MQLDEWTSFIKDVLGPAAVRTFAVAALEALYGRPVLLTDGTGDGGVDAWIQMSDAERVPVQLHSGTSVDWDVKLSADLAKPALRKARQLFFLCAQTPTREKVDRELAGFQTTFGINVTMFDARQLASLAQEHPAVLAKLEPLLPERRPASASAPPSAEAGAAGVPLLPRGRRQLSRGGRAGGGREPAGRRRGWPRADELLERALAVLGGQRHLNHLLGRQLEMLIERGEVTSQYGRVTADRKLRDRVRGDRSASELAREKLREDCVRALEGHVHDVGRRRETVDRLFDDLGLLLRRSVAERLPGEEHGELARRLNALERRLADALKPSGGDVQSALQEIVEVGRGSLYGQALASAELFVQMTKREVGELARALTGRQQLEVALDASVAMPMLCAKFDRMAPGWVTSEVASELHDLLTHRSIGMFVPDLYVEEMAAHLIDAARRYGSLAGEPELARSDNFYVAHYHSVCAARGERATPEGFEELLLDLGLPAGWRDDVDRNFDTVRAKTQRALAGHLERYSMKLRHVTLTAGAALPDEPARPQLVIEHDRRVVGWLDQETRSASERGFVLCTQDRWLLSASATAEWLAVDPAALADLLPLLRPSGPRSPLVSLRELAVLSGEAARSRAAHVWDLLAEIEGPRLADRELLRKARAFKDAWLARQHPADRPGPREWLGFKERPSLDG